MKETFNVLFCIRRTRPLKNGNVSIQMRITVNGHPEELHTKRQINPKCWNQSKGQAVQIAVSFYNTKHPHRSIDMLTPEKAALRVGVLPKRWVCYKDKYMQNSQL